MWNLIKKNGFWLVLMALFAVSFFTIAGCSCGEEPNWGPPIQSSGWPTEADQPPTSTFDQVGVHVNRAAEKAGYGLAWVGVAAAIGLLPLLALFFIPGFLAGRWEKLTEGLAVTGGGIVLYLLAVENGLAWLPLAALLVNIAPGGVLAIWGITSKDDKGKFPLLVLPTIFFGIWISVIVVLMVTKGLVLSPLLTIGVLAGKAWILFLMVGKQ